MYTTVFGRYVCIQQFLDDMYGNVYGAPLVLYVDVKKSTCRQFEQFNDLLNSISLHFDALHDIFFSPWLYLNQHDDF